MYKSTVAAILLAALATPVVAHELSGEASWYGPGFHGKRAADGSFFNQNAMTVAHKTLPFGTRVLLTNTLNGRTVCAVVTDRGPFAKGRVWDGSKAVATKLGYKNAGTAPVVGKPNGC